MALDGIVTRAIVHELEQCIGGRINKIHQPSARDIIFNMRAQGKNVKLLLSANATYPRVHFTEQSFPNPPEAPMFCMLLRKYCEGGFIEAVSQVGMERIIHIDVRQRDELGDVSLKRIIIELMGRHSNLILVDPQTGVQLDGIHHITPSISSFRVVMPGTVYTAPPEQHKLNPLEVTKEQFIAAYHEHSIASTNWLVESFSGISPLIANEIVIQTPTYQEQRDINQLWETFSKLMNQVKQHEYAPMLGDNEQQKSIFSAIPLTQITSNLRRYDSISECMEAYFGDKALRDTVKQKSSDLLRFLQNERNKNVKKLTKLQQDLLEADDAERYRIAGELLFASLHSINKGDKQVELVNYYEESQPIEKIQLDPLLTPSENAQKYFKKYNKFKNSLAVIEEQMKLANEEITYIEGLLQQLHYATLSDIDEIREELVAQGYLRDRASKGKKKKKNARPTLHVYTSSEGIELYVGKNNIQNEYVTNKVGKPNDTWLHTKDIPGSHVLIRSDAYGEDTLHEAAQLAAYFSQAKSSSSVPVDYTLIRHVRKPNGAKPGFVIYDNQKTLFVTPNEDLIKGLRSQTKNN